MQTFTVPMGSFQLGRYPRRKKDLLRAWDAGDEYLLNHIHEQGLLTDTSNVLILNDSFGALSVALAGYEPAMVTDSYLSRQGALLNIGDNSLTADEGRMLGSLDAIEGSFDLVLIKVPKTLAFLEDQLHRVRLCLTADTKVLGAGMAKGIHTSTLKLFERIIGLTTTSLAKKKARLIHSTPDLNLDPGASPFPTHYKLAGTEFTTTNHANVFSREKLDIGTRVLLEHVASDEKVKRIVDLGCGNGVVGLTAAVKNPEAEVIFVDESYMAVASAEVTVRTALQDSGRCQFKVTDCLDGIPARSVDLILINPPYHQERGVDDAVAWQMLRESKDVLRQGGEIRVVGNRHLGYHLKLERLFGNQRVLSEDSKFVVLRATKR